MNSHLAAGMYIEVPAARLAPLAPVPLSVGRAHAATRVWVAGPPRHPAGLARCGKRCDRAS